MLQYTKQEQEVEEDEWIDKAEIKKKKHDLDHSFCVLVITLSTQLMEIKYNRQILRGYWGQK